MLLFFLLIISLLAVLNFIPAPGYTDVAKNCPDDFITAYVISNGYHTGIALPAKNACFNWKAELDSNCADSSWIEFGWGDKDFYMASGTSISLGAKAMFLPTYGVMHVVRYKGNNIRRYYHEDQIKKIQICKHGYDNLTNFITNSFRKNAENKVIPLGTGLYGEWSHFYEAKGTYTFIYNCNNWANEALKKAGVKVPVWGSTAFTIFKILGNEI